MRLKSTSLLRILLIPFLILMLILAGIITSVLYRAGEETTDAVAQKTLDVISSRINAVSEKQLASAYVILNSIAPNSIHSKDNNFRLDLAFPKDLLKIEERLWSATGLFPDINQLAYFGAEDGGFVSVRRMVDEGRVEARYRQPGATQSDVYSMSAPNKKIALLRSDQFDPRVRPWYKNAVAKNKAAWSAVYIDFTKREPLLTLSKPLYASDVDSAQGEKLLGVLATDVSLKQITAALQQMAMPDGSIAFIVERSGELVATSLSELPYVRVSDTALKRQFASESVSPLMRNVFNHVQQKVMPQMSDRLRDGVTDEAPVIDIISTPQGMVQIAVGRLIDPAGLEWITIVAVPRAAIRTEMRGLTIGSLGVALSAILGALLLGYLILRWTMVDIRKLTEAARRVGSGEPVRDIDIQRRDEIGVLAESLQEMQHSLRTDSLTHLLNRDTFISQIDFTRRRSTDLKNLRFALLFIDLDHFKKINDEHGHEAGDIVLIEIARRLESAIRKEDAAARFGGDEFVVYLHGVAQRDQANQLVEKLRQAIEAPVRLKEGVTGIVGASIGLALYPEDGLDMDSLLRASDLRMFEEKSRRKARAR
ncbi:diguanylate cyclase domain-containing protein [Undibacterium sp. Xuan67W]